MKSMQKPRPEILAADLTTGQLNMLLLNCMAEIHDAEEDLRARVIQYTHAENAYRMRKATEFLKSEGTVDARKSHVDLATEKERLAAHLAEGLKEAALERVRDLRAKLNAIQSIGANIRIELEVSKSVEPDWSHKRSA